MSLRTRLGDSFSCVLQGAAAVAAAGVTQTICLPLLCVYEGSSNGASQVTGTSRTGMYLEPPMTSTGELLCAEFLPKVPGFGLLARSVPPVCVLDGESAQDASLQLHQ